MKYEKFKLYRTVLALLLGIIVSSFIIAGNYIVPLIAIAIATIMVIFLKSKVKEPLSDERVDSIAGKAAKTSYSILVLSTSIMGVIFFALRNTHPELLLTGYILSYLTCGALLIYVGFFSYHYKRGQ